MFDGNIQYSKRSEYDRNFHTVDSHNKNKNDYIRDTAGEIKRVQE